MSPFRSIFATAVLFSTAVVFADKPVDGRTPQPGYTPPVLIGVTGENKGPKIRPIAFPAASESWVRVRSAHFVILSSAGEKRTRELAEGLETLAVALTRLAPGIATTSKTPTRVLIFTRHKEVQPYFDYLLNRDSANVTGVFVSQNGSGSMIIDGGFGKAMADRTPFHELVHSLLDRTDKQPALWLDEGLAEYYSAAELRSGSLFAGAPIREHIEILRRGDLLPLSQVFSVVRESDTYNLPHGQRLFYAESWAVVDLLLRRNRQHFYEFFDDVKGSKPVADALQARFGMTVGELERAIRGYGPTFRIPFGASLPVPNVDKSAVVTKLERDDLLYELGAFLQALNPDSGEATRHFEAALQINPKHARALAALGRYEDAIAADPNDAGVYLTYAEALLGTQIGLLAEADQPEEKDAAKYRKARTLAERALTLGADEARARGDYGITFMVEKDSDLGPGLDALRRAHALAPERSDFAVHLFAFERRTGERDEPLLAQLLASRNKQVAYAARSTVVRTELARANALTHKEQLDEAASIIRKLAADTEDPDARRQLQRQADELVNVASTNRQITRYNDAVAQVNAGKYSAARKALAALLADATDPGVIRDVQRLQKELAGKRDLRP